MKKLALITLVLASSQLYGAVLSGPVVNPANGHAYYLLGSNTWTASQAEAVALGGNLATIDDAAENDWVFDTFSAGQRNLWIGPERFERGLRLDRRDSVRILQLGHCW